MKKKSKKKKPESSRFAMTMYQEESTGEWYFSISKDARHFLTSKKYKQRRSAEKSAEEVIDKLNT